MPSRIYKKASAQTSLATYYQLWNSIQESIRYREMLINPKNYLEYDDKLVKQWTISKI